MQKKLLGILLALCMLLAVLPLALTAGAEEETATTTVRDCDHSVTSGKCTCGATAISTAEDLLALMDGNAYTGTDYFLAKDIDMTDASGMQSITSFSGVFDGNGYTISNLSTTYGLFQTATNAWIYDLTVAGTVTGMTADATTVDANYVGGIVGMGVLSADTDILVIENCTNECTVTAKSYVGGIVGCLSGSTTKHAEAAAAATVSQCRNTGAVEATTQYAGGIIGYVFGTDRGTVQHTITECMNTGSVSVTSASSQSDLGGILGIARGASVSDCANIGTVKGNKKNVGGIIGRTYGLNTVKGCYNVGMTYIDTTTASPIIGNVGTSSVSDDSLTANYYTAGGTDETYGISVTENVDVEGSYPNLDFDDVWFITKGGPRLLCMIEEISSEEDLFELMGKDVVGWYELTGNIDMSKLELEEGETQSSIASFSGVFDGNGYTISGLSTTSGLFAAATNAEIYDLTVAGEVSGTENKVGGIVGAGNLDNATDYLVIQNCTNTCTVKGAQLVGGVVGYLGSTADGSSRAAAAAAATVTQCRNTGAVTATGQYAGGVVGYTWGKSGVLHEVTECMNNAYVYGASNDVGGILGIAYFATVTDCVNLGTVTSAKDNAGGIVGRTAGTNVITCSFNGGTITASRTDRAHATVGYKGGTDNPKYNYHTVGAVHDAYKTIEVASDDISNANSYTGLNTNSKWTFTTAGPRLTCVVVAIGDADAIAALMADSTAWNVGNYYILTADIDLVAVEDQSPIGNETTPFIGGFDGNGYEIKGINLVADENTAHGFGLFGVAKNAEIYDLTVSGTVDGGDSLYMVGGIVGNGTLATGEYLYISGCTNNCAVSGMQYVGGIVGGIGEKVDALSGGASAGVATIIGCRNNGDVEAIGGYAESGSVVYWQAQSGGIVGYIRSSSSANHTIAECMNTGDVTGKGGTVENADESLDVREGARDIGGILGIGWCVSVSDCINTGTVTGEIEANIGGIIGRTANTTGAGANSLVNCYNEGDVDDGYAILGVPNSSLTSFGNYYVADKNQNSSYSTWVATANIADASEYTDLNTNNKWVFTEDGPRLKCFSVVISAKVTAADSNYVTVELYAESGVPFWGVEFGIETGNLTLNTEDGFEPTLNVPQADESATGFVWASNSDFDRVAILNMQPEDSTYAKTLVATLVYNIPNGATGDQVISFTDLTAYNSLSKNVDVYGVSASTSLDLTNVSYGHGVVLDSEYVLEYTIKQELLKDLPEDADMYMLFETTDANGNVTVTSVEPYLQSSSNKLRFSAPGIAAKNMGDVVKGTFYYVEEDGTRHYAYTDTYNLISYYEKMHGKGYGTKFDAALNAMLNYGGAAQTYFGYDTDNLASNHLDEKFDDSKTTATATTTVNEGEYTYKAAGSAAQLNQRINLVWYFTLTDTEGTIDTSTIEFRGSYTDINGTDHEFTISGEDLEVADGMITVYIDQIAAKDLRQMVTGALYNVGTDAQVSQSIKSSFECYAASVAEKAAAEEPTDEDTALNAVCRATLAYVDAAAAYLKKTTTSAE